MREAKVVRSCGHAEGYLFTTDLLTKEEQDAWVAVASQSICGECYRNKAFDEARVQTRILSNIAALLRELIEKGKGL